MSAISTVSEIDAQVLAEYLRINELTENDTDTLTTLLTVSKSFIKSYTGRKDGDLDEINDFVIVVLILVQDMWDNRTMYVDTTNLNFTVKAILDLHSVNLLPS